MQRRRVIAHGKVGAIERFLLNMSLWADPKEEMVVISMMQSPLGRHYQQVLRVDTKKEELIGNYENYAYPVNSTDPYPLLCLARIISRSGIAATVAAIAATVAAIPLREIIRARHNKG